MPGVACKPQGGKAATQAKPMRHTNRSSLADIALLPVPALYGVQELQQLCRCMLDQARCVNACCLSTCVTSQGGLPCSRQPCSLPAANQTPDPRLFKAPMKFEHLTALAIHEAACFAAGLTTVGAHRQTSTADATTQHHAISSKGQPGVDHAPSDYVAGNSVYPRCHATYVHLCT